MSIPLAYTTFAIVIGSDRGEETGKRALLGLTRAELSTLAVGLGMPSFTGSQLAKWLYQKRVHTIAEMTDLSKENRRRLEERFCPGIMPPVEAQRSADGTVKYLFPTEDSKAVETVLIPEGERATLCVSCQVGCKMGCTFCHTGQQGFHGNLSVRDILNQIYALPEFDRLTNVVFMGQGEPMDNLDNVLKATELLQASYGPAWSPKRITVSTVGVKNKLKRFVEESNCHLAISLHAARPELRAQLIPAEKGMPIRDVAALLRQYDWSHQRRLTFEYITFAGVNDTPEDGKAIVSLLRGLDCRVNLIRFHEVEGIALRCSAEKRIETLCDYLNAKGITTTVRASRGKDIYAACGQLSTARYGNDKEQNNDDRE